MNGTVEMFGHDFGLVWLLMGLSLLAVIVSFVVSLATGRLVGAIAIHVIGVILLVAAIVLSVANWDVHPQTAFLTLYLCTSMCTLFLFNTADIYGIHMGNKENNEGASAISKQQVDTHP